MRPAGRIPALHACAHLAYGHEALELRVGPLHSDGLGPGRGDGDVGSAHRPPQGRRVRHVRHRRGPIQASYHFSQTAHMALNLTVWAPTGKYDPNDLAN